MELLAPWLTHVNDHRSASDYGHLSASEKSGIKSCSVNLASHPEVLTRSNECVFQWHNFLFNFAYYLYTEMDFGNGVHMIHSGSGGVGANSIAPGWTDCVEKTI